MAGRASQAEGVTHFCLIRKYADTLLRIGEDSEKGGVPVTMKVGGN